MNPQFWQNPPWANGRGGYQMQLTPLAESLWCRNPIAHSEKQAKLRLLREQFKTVVQTTADSLDSEDLLASTIAQRHRLTDTSTLGLPPRPDVNSYGDLGAGPLIASALTVPEDLCLLREHRGHYRLIAACVCSPSYWFLPEKIGQSLHEIHAPVAGLNDALGVRMAQFFRRLPNRRVFQRRNWFIHESSNRFQPAPEERSILSTRREAERLYVRSETQTLRRLSRDLVVFTIGVESHPLREIYDYPLAARALKKALSSRSRAEKVAAGQASYETAVLALLSAAETPTERESDAPEA